jgi:hypothetical protein
MSTRAHRSTVYKRSCLLERLIFGSQVPGFKLDGVHIHIDDHDHDETRYKGNPVYQYSCI